MSLLAEKCKSEDNILIMLFCFCGGLTSFEV